jgi:hypothetical protein
MVELLLKVAPKLNSRHELLEVQFKHSIDPQELGGLSVYNGKQSPLECYVIRDNTVIHTCTHKPENSSFTSIGLFWFRDYIVHCSINYID